MSNTNTIGKYAGAVSRLVHVAQQDHGASPVAAQVLLNLYNGYEFLTDLTDLCRFDPDLLRDALIAIQGRVVLRVEPHTVIENGNAIFEQLADDWRHLGRRERDRNLINGHS